MTAPSGTPGVDRRHRLSDFFHERTNFRFMAHMRRYFVVSVVLVLLGVLLIAVRGLNLGIDFEGGVSWQVDVAKSVQPKVGAVRDLVGKAGVGDFKATISQNPQNGRETIRVQARVVDDPSTQLRKALAAATAKSAGDVTFTRQGAGGQLSVDRVKAPKQAAITAAMQKVVASGSNPQVTVDKQRVVVTVDRLPSSTVDRVSTALLGYAKASPRDLSISTVGPTWGGQVSRKALQALVVFFLVLAVYLTIRFEFKMAIAAIVAVLHDIVFTAAAYALMQFTVSPATVTAFLTILGFSLYDTVVVFDKTRENQALMVGNRNMTYAEMANRSLNQVLMRSLSTAFVALMPVMALLFIGSGLFGATALEDFALALLAGLFIGTYSSIFVATPLLVAWKEREPQYRAIRERAGRFGDRPAPVVPVRQPAPRLVPVAGDGTMSNGEAVALTGDTAARATPARTPSDWDTTGVPGPPAVGRSPVAPRPRQQRGKKRKR